MEIQQINSCSLFPTHLLIVAGSVSSVLTRLTAFTRSSRSKWKAIKMWRRAGRSGSCRGSASPQGPRVYLDFRPQDIFDNRPPRTRSMFGHSHCAYSLLFSSLKSRHGVSLRLILLATLTASLRGWQHQSTTFTQSLPLWCWIKCLKNNYWVDDNKLISCRRSRSSQEKL